MESPINDEPRRTSTLLTSRVVQKKLFEKGTAKKVGSAQERSKMKELKGKLKNLAKEQKALGTTRLNSVKRAYCQTRVFEPGTDLLSSCDANRTQVNSAKKVSRFPAGENDIREKLKRLRDRIRKAFDNGASCVCTLKEKLKTLSTFNNV